jgi:uncharacterized protein YgiB involved in biofilm formation
MTTIRRRARYIALAWLLCQAASLYAFAADCCASHVEITASQDTAEPCHESEAPKPKPGDACPMAHGDGAACPMHGSKTQDCGVMTGDCAGPGSNLVTLFAYVGAIERPDTSALVLESSPAFFAPLPVPLDHAPIPDAPPPKA